VPSLFVSGVDKPALMRIAIGTVAGVGVAAAGGGVDGATGVTTVAAGAAGVVVFWELL
jgi:hypothetical protein